MTVGLGGRLASLGGVSFVLAALIFAQFSFDRWQLSTHAANIDFFTLWSVPRALTLAPGTDIYSPEGQRALGDVMAREAERADTSPAQRRVTAVVRQLYGGRVDATATPFAYALAGMLSSGDYDRDLRRFLVLSWIACALAIGVVCWLLRFQVVSTLLALVLFSSTFAPLLADLRVANVNQVQLLGIAGYLWCIARGQLWMAGAVLGLAIAFKPNIALVFLFTVVLGVVDRDVARRRGVFLGGLLAAAAGMLVSTAYFGNTAIWASFAEGLRRTTDLTYPLENGNFSMSALLHAWFGIKAAWAIGLTLVLVLTALVVRSRRDRPEDPAPDRDLHEAFAIVGAGCAVMLLSSNLAWLHYYVLLIPLALYLIRPVPDADPARSRRVMGAGAAVASLLLLSSFAHAVAQDAQAVAVLVTLATLILLAATMDDLWLQRASSTASTAPRPRRGPRPRRPGMGPGRRALAHR